MGNGANPNVKSHVTSVQLLDDNSVVLNVLFDGFTAGEPVEISGYVTQTKGAYSSFYLYTTAPNLTPPQTSETVPVTIDEKIADLRNSDPLTVVTKVSKVWPTALASKPAGATTGPGPGDEIPTDPTNPASPTKEIVATWEAELPPKGANW